jgi:hypothetical protein
MACKSLVCGLGLFGQLHRFTISSNHERIMPRLADGARRLSESLGCEVAGVTPPKRRAWIKRGVLPQSDAKMGLTELQVVELAVLEQLHALLGPGDAAVVWREAGEAIKDAIFADRLDLVVDSAWRQCRLVSSDAELAEAVATGREVRAIPLAPLVKKTRDAVRRLAVTPDPLAARSGRATDDPTQRQRGG